MARPQRFFDMLGEVTRVQGTGVYLSSDPDSVPITLLTDVQHDQFGNELRRGLLGVRSAGMKFEDVGPVGAVGQSLLHRRFHEASYSDSF